MSDDELRAYLTQYLASPHVNVVEAMGWARVNADGSMERVDVDESRLVDRYGSGWVDHVPVKYPSRKRLAPRWQVPAIKRRRAGVARAYRALAEQHNANVLKCANMRWGRV